MQSKIEHQDIYNRKISSPRQIANIFWFCLGWHEILTTANWRTNKGKPHTYAKSGNHDHHDVLMERKTFNHSANLRRWQSFYPENQNRHNLGNTC